MTRKLEPEPLPPGAWRLDPFTRVLRYVYDDPEATVPDAFDEPLEIAPEPKRLGGRPRKPIDHGTPAGARAHARHGERPCDDCYRAQLDYRKTLAARRAAEGDPRYVCADCGARKSRKSTRCDPCERRNRWSKTYRKAA